MVPKMRPNNMKYAVGTVLGSVREASICVILPFNSISNDENADKKGANSTFSVGNRRNEPK